MPLSPPAFPDVNTPCKIDWRRGGISESWSSQGGPKATVVYQCLWADRYDLATELMGGYPVGSTGFTDYIPPHRYPPSPNLICQEISSIEGLGALKRGFGSRWLPYKYAIVTAVYSTPTYDVSVASAAGQIDPSSPILYCKQRIRASSAFVVLPRGKIRFAVSGKTVDSDVARPAAQSEITLEFPRIAFNPYLLVRPYIGKTNTVAMWGHDPDCLLLDSIDTETGASTDGTLDCSATLTYLGRDTSWNTLINEDGDPEAIEFVGSGAPVFTAVNHLALFT